jgi:uncharacterized membrane protein
MKQQYLRYLGLAVVFLWFAIGGVGHFLKPQMFVSVVPPYVPFPLEVVYITGVMELLGAIGVCLPRWRQRAGTALFIFTICVTPANIYMWMNAELFPGVSETALGVRLIIQVLLLACIWWSTRERHMALPSGDPLPQG